MDISTDKTWVYVLKCPMTYEVKYVGRTWKPKERLKQHIMSSLKYNGNNPDLARWICLLNIYGYNPIFKIIDDKDTEDNWIVYYLGKGDLFNRHRLNRHKDATTCNFPILPQHYAKLMREIRENSKKGKTKIKL